MKLLQLIFAVLFIFCSCATVEEMTESEMPEEKVADDQRPGWYDYSNRSFADTLNFVGVGLASDVDSNTAQEKARRQAEANLRAAIDTHAENVRVERAESAGGEMFSTAEFIINLRNAVQEMPLEKDLEITAEHTESSDSVHQVYVMTTIPRETAVQALDAALQVDDFTHLLHER